MTVHVEVTAMPVRTDEDVVRLRKQVREAMISIGFSLIDQTKVITAASELARNTLRYGGGGEVTLRRVDECDRKGILIVFSDEGPGIADVELALTDGYTSGGGLGLGLSGAKRLVDEFEVDTAPGEGTRVNIAKWKRF